jgi:CHASE2 domain-containing sensor protein
MASRKITDWLRRPSTGGALVAILAGFAVWALPLGSGLERMSFDLLTRLQARSGFPELVLIEMDETSHSHLQQDYGKPWSRRLHAQLVDYLRAEGARVVVFDAEFYERGENPSANTELATALRAHGRVVLAAALEHIGKPGFGGTTIRRPLPELLGPGVSWGVSWNLPGPKGEEDGIVRVHPQGRDPEPSLTWVAATAVDAIVTRNARHDAERWVRHYGPGRTLPRVSYWQATNEAAGYYRGKTVFIGGRPGTGFVGQEGDQFRTPWSHWSGSPVSGLELTATAWLNLVRGDWLRRARPGMEALAILVFGALFGGAISIGPARRAFAITALSFLIVCGVAFWLFRAESLWCDWAVVAFVQVPVGVAWRALLSHRQLRREKQWLESPLQDIFPDSAVSPGASRPAAIGSSAVPGTALSATATGAPLIPDYELLRCVGRGAYGEVWLARDILGGFRAVKIVRRVAFDDNDPYEREFRGLQKFAPVSREHPGLIQVLHVGLERAGGFFYYVMEAGDDEEAAQQIDPDRYTPRNLGRDLRRRRRLDPPQTAQLGLALCDALGFLHRRGLIHRDIKPANVIFVNGRPKLADAGLVTDLASRAHGVTQVGTEGYIPPEGAGTAAGDVFALGRLLQETLDHAEKPGDEATQSLRLVILQAQAETVEERFASASALGGALRDWQNKSLPPRPQTI